MKDRNGNELKKGDKVDCYPDETSMAFNDFTGTIVDFRTGVVHGTPFAVVKDQDGSCFDMESHEIELATGC